MEESKPKMTLSDDKKQILTRERLQKVAEEFYLEYTCIYVRNHCLMLRIKESGEWEDGMTDAMKEIIDKEIDDKNTAICEDMEPKITVAELQAWFDLFRAEQFMIDHKKAQ